MIFLTCSELNPLTDGKKVMEWSFEKKKL